MKKTQEYHYVYVLSAFGKYYFGYTTSPSDRESYHKKCVSILVYTGKCLFEKSCKKYLKFHVNTAMEMRKKNIWSSQTKAHVKFEIIFKSKIKEMATHVESLLILSHLDDPDCFNKRRDKVIYMNHKWSKGITLKKPLSGAV